MTKTSNSVPIKHLKASSGEHTTGSIALNEVFTTMGQPVLSKNFEIKL